jgi:hypothetical protein
MRERNRRPGPAGRFGGLADGCRPFGGRGNRSGLGACRRAGGRPGLGDRCGGSGRSGPAAAVGTALTAADCGTGRAGRRGRPLGRRSGRHGRRGPCGSCRRAAAIGLSGPRLLRLLGRECFLEPADYWRLDCRGRRPHKLAHLLELGHDGLALDAELFCELVYPDLRHCAPFTRSGSSGPVSRSGQRVLRPASAFAVHRRMLIGRSSQSQPAFPGRVAPALPFLPHRGRDRPDPAPTP